MVSRYVIEDEYTINVKLRRSANSPHVPSSVAPPLILRCSDPLGACHQERVKEKSIGPCEGRIFTLECRHPDSSNSDDRGEFESTRGNVKGCQQHLSMSAPVLTLVAPSNSHITSADATHIVNGVPERANLFVHGGSVAEKCVRAIVCEERDTLMGQREDFSPQYQCFEPRNCDSTDSSSTFRPGSASSTDSSYGSSTPTSEKRTSRVKMMVLSTGGRNSPAFMPVSGFMCTESRKNIDDTYASSFPFVGDVAPLKPAQGFIYSCDEEVHHSNEPLYSIYEPVYPSDEPVYLKRGSLYHGNENLHSGKEPSYPGSKDSFPRQEPNLPRFYTEHSSPVPSLSSFETASTPTSTLPSVQVFDTENTLISKDIFTSPCSKSFKKSCGSQVEEFKPCKSGYIFVKPIKQHCRSGSGEIYVAPVETSVISASKRAETLPLKGNSPRKKRNNSDATDIPKSIDEFSHQTDQRCRGFPESYQRSIKSYSQNAQSQSVQNNFNLINTQPKKLYSGHYATVPKAKFLYNEEETKLRYDNYPTMIPNDIFSNQKSSQVLYRGAVAQYENPYLRPQFSSYSQNISHSVSVNKKSPPTALSNDIEQVKQGHSKSFSSKNKASFQESLNNKSVPFVGRPDVKGHLHSLSGINSEKIFQQKNSCIYTESDVTNSPFCFNTLMQTADQTSVRPHNFEITSRHNMPSKSTPSQNQKWQSDNKSMARALLSDLLTTQMACTNKTHRVPNSIQKSQTTSFAECFGPGFTSKDAKSGSPLFKSKFTECQNDFWFKNNDGKGQAKSSDRRFGQDLGNSRQLSCFKNVSHSNSPYFTESLNDFWLKNNQENCQNIDDSESFIGSRGSWEEPNEGTKSLLHSRQGKITSDTEGSEKCFQPKGDCIPDTYNNSGPSPVTSGGNDPRDGSSPTSNDPNILAREPGIINKQDMLVTEETLTAPHLPQDHQFNANKILTSNLRANPRSVKYLVEDSASPTSAAHTLDGCENFGFESSFGQDNQGFESSFGYLPFGDSRSLDPGYVSERSDDDEDDEDDEDSSSDEESNPRHSFLEPPHGIRLDITYLTKIFSFINKSSMFDVSISKNSRGLGLALTGGIECENALYPGLIRIRKLYPQTPAWVCGQLQENDFILEANGRQLTGLTSHEALEMLRVTGTEVHLVVCRAPEVLTSEEGDTQGDSKEKGVVITSLTTPQAININSFLTPSPSFSTCGEFEIHLRKVSGSLGFTLRKNDNSILGHTIRSLVKEPALSDGRLKPGDKLLSVNGTDMCGLSHEEAVHFLRTCPESVVIRIYRDAMQTPVSPASPTDKEFSKPKALRKEARDMLSARKQSFPNLEGNLTVDTMPRRRKLKNSSPDTKIDKWESLVRKAEESKPCIRNDTSLSREVSPFDNSHSDVLTVASSSSRSGTTDSRSSSANSYKELSSRESSTLSPANSSCSESRPKRPTFLDLTSSHSSRKSHFTPPHEEFPSPPAPRQFDSLDSAPQLTSAHSDTPAFSHLQACYRSINIGSSFSPFNDQRLTNTSSDHNISTHNAESPHKKNALLKWKGVVFTPEEEETTDHFNEEETDRFNEDDTPDHISGENTKDNFTTMECKSGSFKSEDDEKASTVITDINPESQNAQVVTLQLTRGWNSRLGFSLQNYGDNTTIVAIYAGSVAANDGRLRIGDVILKVNEYDVRTWDSQSVIELLRKTTGKINLNLERLET